MALPISLSVYDVANSDNDMIQKLNSITHAVGLGGVFHGGIVVDGLEWSFGYCESGSGVYACKPKLNPMYTFRESVDLGSCLKTKQEVRDVLKSLKAAWAGTTYEVLSRNCNHFCEAFASELGCKPTPPWLNRMAHGADSTYAAYTSAKHAAAAVYHYFWPDQGLSGASSSGSLEASSHQQEHNRNTSSSDLNRNSAPSSSDSRPKTAIDLGRDSYESLFARRAFNTTERPETPGASGMASTFSASSLFARQALPLDPPSKRSYQESDDWVHDAAAAAAAATRAAEELQSKRIVTTSIEKEALPLSTFAESRDTGKHILDM